MMVTPSPHARRQRFVGEVGAPLASAPPLLAVVTLSNRQSALPLAP